MGESNTEVETPLESSVDNQQNSSENVNNDSQSYQKTKINVKHIFHGEINHNQKAVGFHHRNYIGYQGKARVIDATVSNPDKNGVYRAKVEVFDIDKNIWIEKLSLSSFFPDSWSIHDVHTEIIGAFKNQPNFNGKKWQATSPSGIEIFGYIDDNGDINTAYPKYEPNS